MGPAGAIRAGDYKLIEVFETGKKELYNLRQDTGSKMPTVNPDYNPGKDWR